MNRLLMLIALTANCQNDETLYTRLIRNHLEGNGCQAPPGLRTSGVLYAIGREDEG